MFDRHLDACKEIGGKRKNGGCRVQDVVLLPDEQDSGSG